MAKKAKQDSTTLKEIAAGMDDVEGDVSSAKGRTAFLQSFFERLTAGLADGVKVKIPEFCILQVRDRPARMGRNPATGETIKIKASKKVSFRAAKGLKEAVL